MSRGVFEYLGICLHGIFNDHIVYMIVGFIFKAGGWAFIGIWVFNKLNMVC